MIPATISAALLVAALPNPPTERQPAQVLALVLKGRPTGLVGEFVQCDDQLCAMPDQWTTLGLVLPRDFAASALPVPMSALPGVKGRINQAAQLIYIDAELAALRPVEIGDTSSPVQPPLARSGLGAVVNYDLLSTYSKSNSSVAGLIGVRAFSSFGLLENSAVVTLGNGHTSVRRINTAYTYADPDRLLRVRIGDIVTGALGWTRAIRLGGIQLGSDFNLRPDLVTYPLPGLRSSTLVPATVSLVANGILQSTTDIQPGPFLVHVMPVISGVGEAVVTTQDELGRQFTINLPFYASRELLSPGLTSFALDAGLVRETDGLNTDRYAQWAANGSARHGVASWLTIEGHGETTKGLGLLGIGAVGRIGALGILNLSASGSTQGGRAGRVGTSGYGASLSVQRVTRRYTFNISAIRNSSGFRDIAATRGFALAKSTLDASFGYQTDHWGVVGVSYVSREDYPSTDWHNQAIDPEQQGSRYRIVNFNYNIRSARFGTLYASGFRDFGNSRGYGLSLACSFALGSYTSASVGGLVNNGRPAFTATVAKNAQAPGDVGYRLQDNEGSFARRTVAVEYLRSTGRFTAEVEQSSSGIFARVGTRGAFAIIDGAVFASDSINDSFAVVRTGNVGNIPVQYENRPIGTTDARGRLLVPSLLSYQNNRLSLDTSRLPPDVVVGQSFTVVRPRDGTGIMVAFAVKKVRAAVVQLRDTAGRSIPIGSLVQIGEGDPQPVGYGGEAYLQELAPSNLLKVTKPDGSVCSATVAYRATVGDIPTIGPVSCR